MFNVGILGYGVIGKGVFQILSNINNINVLKVFDREKNIKDYDKTIFTSNLEEVINNKDIDLVVEVLGGYDFASMVDKNVLLNKKHLVTANKEVIAKDLDKLINLAYENNVSVLYEASVGGGIPIIKNLKELTKLNKIKKITGILNGTTNFILTKMSKGMEFNDALKLAQNLGFAESDPTNDLEGLDMVRKIAILADLAFNTFVDIDLIKPVSFKTITKDIINEAKKNNKIIKYVCSAELMEDKKEIKIEVGPKEFNKDHTFASVNDEFNGIELITYPNDSLTFLGKGAGSLPTASAICLDIIDIIDNKNIETYQNINTYEIKGGK